jgi:signal transduction histidine kinase
MERIFVPFQRGEKTGETGIGLVITKRIAQVYGGDIIVYNDQGACFEVTLRDWELPQR